MIPGAALAAVVMLRLVTDAPGCDKALVALACPDAVASSWTAMPGAITPIEAPCLPAPLRVSCPGFVDEELEVRAAGEVTVTLARAGDLTVQVGDGPETALAWFRADPRSLSQRTLSPGGNCVAVRPGTGCAVQLRTGMAPSAHSVTVAAGQTVALPPAEWHAGVVLDGAVVDGRGVGVAATVTLRRGRPAEAGSAGPGEPCALALDELSVTRTGTDRDGAFRLGPGATGQWTLSVRADGYSPVDTVVALAAQPPEVHLDPIVVRAVADLQVRVDSSACDLEPPFGLTIEREATDEVMVADRWKIDRELEIAQSLAVELHDLSPGFYRLRLRKAGTDLEHLRLVELFQGRSQEVTLRPAPITLFGDVTRSGRAVPGADVAASRAGAHFTTVTDTAGAYELRVWTPADYLVEVAGAGEQTPFTTHVDLRREGEDGRVRLDVSLPEGSLTGVVVSAEGKVPLDGAQVMLECVVSSRDMTSRQVQTTGRDGAFAFTNLERGAKTRLQVRADGYEPASVEPARDRAAVTVIVELRKGVAVRGKVVGPSGEAVVGASVGCCALDVLGPPSMTTATDAGGGFALSVSAGATLTAVARGYAIGWASAAEGETTIRLAPLSAPVPLRLVSAGGDGIGGTALGFMATDGVVIGPMLLGIHGILNRARPVTAPDGRVAIVALPPGQYLPLLTLPGGFKEVGWLSVPSTSETTLVVSDPGRR